MILHVILNFLFLNFAFSAGDDHLSSPEPHARKPRKSMNNYFMRRSDDDDSGSNNAEEPVSPSTRTPRKSMLGYFMSSKHYDMTDDAEEHDDAISADSKKSGVRSLFKRKPAQPAKQFVIVHHREIQDDETGTDSSSLQNIIEDVVYRESHSAPPDPELSPFRIAVIDTHSDDRKSSHDESSSVGDDVSTTQMDQLRIAKKPSTFSISSLVQEILGAPPTVSRQASSRSKHNSESRSALPAVSIGSIIDDLVKNNHESPIPVIIESNEDDASSPAILQRMRSIDSQGSQHSELGETTTEDVVKLKKLRRSRRTSHASRSRLPAQLDAREYVISVGRAQEPRALQEDSSSSPLSWPNSPSTIRRESGHFASLAEELSPPPISPTMKSAELGSRPGRHHGVHRTASKIKMLSDAMHQADKARQESAI